MISFWNSIEALTKEGFKVAWLGVAVAIAGRLVPDHAWLSWVGIGVTALGLVLRQQGERLKKLDAAPRKLSTEQTHSLLRELKNVPKAPVHVQFLGHDSEAKRYAAQFKELFESAGFKVSQFCGAIAFEPLTGLSITVCEWDSQNPTALGIQRAFAQSGMELGFQAVMKQKEPTIEFCVHGKPQRQAPGTSPRGRSSNPSAAS